MGIAALNAPAVRAVFLDRDGVLNEAVVRDGRPFAPLSPESFCIASDARQCLHDLKRTGFLLIVVSNQPDIARGRLTLAAAQEMHVRLRAALPLDDILVCIHDAQDDCACRKPRPGMLLEARDKYTVDLSRSFLIGDRWSDVDAGNAAGSKTVLIDCGYQERGPATPPAARVASLRDAVNWILQQTEEEIGRAATSV